MPLRQTGRPRVEPVVVMIVQRAKCSAWSRPLVVAVRTLVVVAVLQGCGGAQESGDWIKATAAPTTAFSGLSVRDARERALSQHRLLLIDTTATWCPPCRQMEATTWRDPQVIDWISKHSIAVQVDVDRLSEVAVSLGIRAMPTMIVFRDGKEVDRVTGLKSSGELLAWLELARARSDSDAPLADDSATARIDYEGVPDDGTEDVFMRQMAANAALADGRHDEALAGAQWLWVHSEQHSAHFAGLRLSLLVSTMRVLVEEHPPAREAFGRFLQSAQREIDAGHVGEAVWADWMALCCVLGEQSRLMDWYEQHRDPDGSIDAGRYCKCRWIADDLFDQFTEQRRFAEAGRVYRYPSAKAGGLVSMHQMMTDPPVGVPALSAVFGVSKLAGRTAYVDQDLREKLGKLSATLVAADRPDDARGVASLLLKELPDRESRKALVKWALDWAQPLSDHVRWYAEALEMGADVESMEPALEAALHR